MKKVLMVATYGDFFAAFEVSNIRILNRLGCEVYLCANWTDSRYNYKAEKLAGLVFHKINIGFSRSPFSLTNIKRFYELKQLIANNDFYLVDCHNAVIGIYARLAASINKVPQIMYTAHGFQFYKNGPKRDWIIYYPIERLFSRITDQMIVINEEDFLVAKRMKAKKVDKIPGVGFDYEYFSKKENINRKYELEKLGIPEDSFVILSVGELSKRKNHQVIIRAIKSLGNPKIYYLIAGQGEYQKSLEKLISKLNLGEQIKLLGHRSDIKKLNEISDIAAFPSLREGLGIAGLESMASGLPLVSSNARGINDYSIDGVTGFKCNYKNSQQFSTAIEILEKDRDLLNNMSVNAREVSSYFRIEEVETKMENIYIEILGK